MRVFINVCFSQFSTIRNLNIFESPLPEGRGFLDTVLGRLRRQVTLCLA
jgi:hypothetical protein